MSRILSVLAFTLAAALAVLPAAPAAFADTLDDVRARGTLRVGVSAFVPWTFESRSGALEGFEIDVGQRLAQDIGVEAAFVLVPFEEIIPRLHAGEFDMIAAGMAITPARALEINFSRPYFESGVTIATNTAATAEIERLADLNAPGVSVAAVTDTLAAALAPRLFGEASLTLFADSEAARASVLAGESMVYIASVPEAKFFTLKHADAVDLPLPEPMVRSVAGFGVRKGEHDWLAFLNAWIEARTADLWLTSAHGHWFESLDWADRVDDGGGAAE
ncbi:MAG: transporter substrate-binding domain-containing protein [Pseudomonadota bacterium]